MGTEFKISGPAAIRVVLSAAVYFGSKRRQAYKSSQPLSPHVKDASVRVENAIRHDYHDYFGISVDELAAQIGTDIVAIDRRIFEIQTSSRPAVKEKTDAITSYLWGCQSLLRCIRSKYAKAVEVRKIRSWAEIKIRRMEEALECAGARGRMDPGEYVVHRKSAIDTIDVLEKAIFACEQAISTVARAASELADRRSRILSMVPSGMLISSTALERSLKHNTGGKPPAFRPWPRWAPTAS